MKSLSNKIKEQQINEWVAKEGDEKIVTSWAARRKAKYSSSKDNVKIKKFIEFFRQLKECSGLGVSIVRHYGGRSNYDDILSELYYIRETEPDKKAHTGDTPRTYDYILYLLFDEEQLNIHSKRQIDEDYVLILVDIEDDIAMLRNLGFDKYDIDWLNDSHSYLYKELEETPGLYIPFTVLYENIDKIYKAFFE